MPLRKSVFWAHLVAGVAVGLVVLVMSVTGVLLTYQKQMTQWADRAHWTDPAMVGNTVPLSTLVRSAQEYAPEATLSSVTLHTGLRGPAALSLGEGRVLYLDPTDGSVRGESSTRLRAFFSTVTRIHRWFAVSGEGRAKARAVTGWSNLAFLFLILSGLYLWIPKRMTWQHVRPVLLLKPSAKGKARDFNWHHVFGFWTSLPLLLVVASATVISFPWASNLAYRVVGEDPPIRSVAPATPREQEFAPFDPSSLDPLLQPNLERVVPWRTLRFSIPRHAESALAVRIEQGWGGQPQKRHTVTYDGSETTVETFADQSRGRRFRTFLRFAHTGEYFGVGGQTVAGLVSLFSVLMVWSGFALAWRRLIVPALRRRP